MLKILILQGGDSSEREISLRSARNVAAHAEQAGYEVLVADPGAPDFDLEALCQHVDMVFPILHGAGGEDGVLQKRLEATGRPFLGSGSAACELTFDKARYRNFVATHGIRVPSGEVVNHAQFNASGLRKAPYVLKPIDGGSSVDTVILHDVADEPDTAYFDELFARNPTMLLEQLIVGQELTVGVLDKEALPVILVVPPSGEAFDYENKYNGRTQEIVNPGQVPEEAKQRAQALAFELHRLTGCRHLSRSDMILTPDGELYVLETNTIPGLTEQSLLPKMALAAGLDMTALVKCFVRLVNRV